MVKDYDVAVVGATGAVGETILSILAQRGFPVNNLYPLASSKSVGNTVMFSDKPLSVGDLSSFDFKKVHIAFFSAGGAVSKMYVPKATANGCIVIDNTSEFRYEKDVPLVIPEVNPETIAHYKNRYIIANPNCSTMQMLVVLKPIYDAVGITRINVATYQAVSGSGRQAIVELASQTAQLLSGQNVNADVYPKQIAFNVLPQIGAIQENGYTWEEMKMAWETKKILGDDKIRVNATAVRVPVFHGHSEAIHLETRRKLSLAQAEKLLREAPGVVFMKDDYPTAVTEARDTDPVYVGRVRKDISHPNGLNLWVTADNIRKGAALNAIQIAEILIKNYLK